MRAIHDRDAILNAWARGETSPQIAAAVGSSPVYIRTIVKSARESGDARAVRRGPAVVRQPSPSGIDHDAILDRWRAGWGVEEIARYTSTTPNTIYGMLIAYRRRGDPRAVVRKVRGRKLTEQTELLPASTQG